ncbi:PHP domain-containing protein [Halolamina salifodinae]|uniref:Putative metal-dependent phosphoesterase TrpH n=1 Tax=Halolamina salifodinae TaxID=1202767 RepID=A0A8T4H3Q5_9EURY|nr:PHP domain-containing protein [Halolamina salifodinae]MBP1988265.1 putative metal-dependent phosphoesterase TrpH [Halolamina salifodinae]
MSVVADLHTHTTVSDGTLSLPDLVATAREEGLAAVAVTDHDRYHPDISVPVERRGDLLIVRGIELRVDAGDERVDLLGYGLTETDALTAEVERLQQDRIDRGRRIVENVEAELGVDLGIEPHEGLGRPHIARAVVESDADYDTIGAVFDDLIGDDGPCYVAREVPDFETGRELLEEACAFVGLAHPLRYDDPEAALELTAELDAVERYYPYDRPVSPDEPESLDPRPVEAAISEHDLLATGGTDAHEEELAVDGLPRAAWKRVREHLPEAVSLAESN